METRVSNETIVAKNIVDCRKVWCIEVALGVGAKELARQLSKMGHNIKGYSCSREECENGMKYLIRLRVRQINGAPGNYGLVVYPEIFGEVVSKMQNVKTEDGIVLSYEEPFGHMTDAEGEESLQKVVAMCDRMGFRITSGLTTPTEVMSNVIGLEWNEERGCHLSSHKATNEDLMMKVWIDYPRYQSWGELRYQLEDPGAVFEYIQLITRKQSRNYEG